MGSEVSAQTTPADGIFIRSTILLHTRQRLKGALFSSRSFSMQLIDKLTDVCNERESA